MTPCPTCSRGAVAHWDDDGPSCVNCGWRPTVPTVQPNRDTRAHVKPPPAMTLSDPRARFAALDRKRHRDREWLRAHKQASKCQS